MEIDGDESDRLAAAFLEAARTRTPLAPLAERRPGLGLADAYRIQEALVARKRKSGMAPAGMKVGSTSRRVQEQFGISEPVYGHLFGEERCENGAAIVSGRLIDPKIECEIAFRLGRDLAGPGVTEEGALAAAATAMGAFEIIDARTREWRVGVVDLVADNAVNAGFVIGPEHPLAPGLDLARTTVAMSRNGGAPTRGSGAVVLGHPARVLAWLANWLGASGRKLEKDWIVLTGSLAEPLPARAGDRFEAVYSDLGRIAVSFA